jgi:hypothetical protein
MGTRYISGLPSLQTGDTITSIGFPITNVSSYFYAPSYVWSLTGTTVNSVTGDPDSVPSANGGSGTISSGSTTILSGKFSDTNVVFTVIARNSASNNGTGSTYTDTTKRVDTVSNETLRKASGSGQYPTSGYGSTFTSSNSLKTTYTEELQLINGVYKIPSGNYSAFGTNIDYSTGMGTGVRWVTFKVPDITSTSTIDFTFQSPTNFGGSTITPGLSFYVKNEGSTGWIDGNASYSGTGSPSADGTPAMVFANSSAITKRVTFGAIPRTGGVYVRIGLTYNMNMTFTGISTTVIN